MTVKLCTFYMHSLYCDLLRLTMGKGSCRAVSFPVWICWWIIDILSFSWLILSHMCVPLCFLNIPILGTICLRCTWCRVNVLINKLRIGVIHFQVQCLFFRCFWYFLFYERVHHIFFKVVWNIIIFHFYDESYWCTPLCFMLLLRRNSAKFSKKDQKLKSSPRRIWIRINANFDDVRVGSGFSLFYPLPYPQHNVEVLVIKLLDKLNWLKK